MHPTPDPDSPAEGRPLPTLPGMTLLYLRGRGAVSRVYAARRDVDGWSCAVKVIDGGPEQRARARREIDVLLAVRVPGLVRLHDVLATDDGRLALVLDLISGGVLREVIRQRGRLVPREVVGVLRVVLHALAELHARGITHGDLSAGNVLIAPDGRAVLGDLGSARLTGEVPDDVWGTRGFLAPEIELGARPSPASDVYGVGALAWLMLAGEVPGTAYGRTPAHEALPDCPPHLVDLVTACLAGEPDARPTAAEALRRCADLGPQEPLGLPDGPGLGDRLTSRLRWDSDQRREDGWGPGCNDPAGPADAARPGRGPLAQLGLGCAGDPGSPRALAAMLDPGRHRGSIPGRLARIASAGGRAVTGAPGRTLLAVLAGVVAGLLGWVGVATFRGDAVPMLGQMSWPWPVSSSREDVGATAVPAQQPRTTEGATSPQPAAPDATVTGRPTTYGSTPGRPTQSGTSSPGQPPARALPGLLAERARAYATADPAPLELCYTPDAAGLSALRADIARLERQGKRYVGLTYTVSDARVLSTSEGEAERPSQARVEARVATGPYVVADRDGADREGTASLDVPAEVDVPAEADAGAASGTTTPSAQRMVFELRWTDGGLAPGGGRIVNRESADQASNAPSSRRALSAVRKRPASAPSTRRWS